MFLCATQLLQAKTTNASSRCHQASPWRSHCPLQALPDIHTVAACHVSMYGKTVDARMATSAPAVIYAGLCKMTGGGEVRASAVKNFRNLRFVENDLSAYLVGARVVQVLT